MTEQKSCIACCHLKPLSEFALNGYGRRKCKVCSYKVTKERYAANPEQYRAMTARHRAHKNTTAYETRACLHCGNEFRFLKSLENSRKGQGKFCSLKCRANNGKTETRCQSCRRLFTIWRCMLGRRKYCSQVCAGTARDPQSINEEFLRKQHYNTAAWRSLSDEIIQRDEHQCTRCSSAVDLVVHHIIPWIISRDDSPDNLTTLCRTCHSNLHRADDGRLVRRMPWLPWQA